MRELFLAIVINLFLGYVLLQWFSGCGEHYIDAAGVTHKYECR